MTITDLEFYLLEIACGGGGVSRPQVPPTAGRKAPVQSVLVRLATESGMEGWGEAQLEWRAAELAARRNALLPILTGRSIFDIEELLDLQTLRSGPAPSALRCALEMASWDLVGQASGQPLCHLFGGRYRQRVPLAVPLAGRADQTPQLARELAEQGFHSQILTSCGQVERDLQVLAAVREAAGERVELQFDAAGSYDLQTARELCRQLESGWLHCVLDPLRNHQLDQIASLRRQTSVPLAVRRAIQGPADVLALLRCGAAQSVVVDLQLVGGILPARHCAAIAQAGSISASLAAGPSLGVAVAAMLQLAASTPAFSGCNECTYQQLQDDLLIEPLEVVDGMIAVPQAPGLGIQIDRSRVEHCQIT